MCCVLNKRMRSDVGQNGAGQVAFTTQEMLEYSVTESAGVKIWKKMSKCNGMNVIYMCTVKNLVTEANKNPELQYWIFYFPVNCANYALTDSRTHISDF